MPCETKIRLGFRQKLLLVCALVCIVTLSGVFFYLDKRLESFYLEAMHKQARVLFKQIVITRKWIADHGGIFVEQLPWVSPNPYLGKESIVIDARGKKYVKENPAMVTRELSQYAKEQGSYWFHITSLKLVNPSNVPDRFEREALENFEKNGREEAWSVSPIGKEEYFRYIAPLYIEPACLKCHSKHGYKVGDVRGAISVAIPLKSFYLSLKKERMIEAGFTVSVAIVLMLGLYITLTVVLVAPIKQLRNFAVAWKQGSQPPAYGKAWCREDMEKLPGDELHDLFTELCNLHETVTSHEKELEAKVKAATEELSRMNEQLVDARDRYREASLKKSHFIAGLSHELRTPLTSVKGAVSYITRKIEGGDEGGDSTREELFSFLEILNRNINRLVKLVEDTLDLEKIESGQMELHPSVVDFKNLLNEVREELIPIASENGIDITVTAEEDLAASADRDRIRQVMDNLVMNVLRHAPRSSEVALEASRSGNWLAVRVADQGPGIPADMQEKIFERFQKGSKEGTGLGLTISKGIVEAHGGEIGVESDGTHGSTFYFKLPVSKNSLQGKSEERDS